MEFMEKYEIIENIETGQRFSSPKFAAKSCGMSPSTLFCHLNGKYDTFAGYHWHRIIVSDEEYADIKNAEKTTLSLLKEKPNISPNTIPENNKNEKILIEFFKYMYEHERSKSTFECYKSKIKNFIYIIGNKDLDKATYDDVETYIAQYINNKAATKNMARNAIKSLYKWMIEYDYCTFDPTKRLKAVRGENRLPVFLTSTEINRMYDALDENNIIELRNKALLAFMFATGCRETEVINSKFSDISDYGNNKAIRIFGKGRKERMIPISKFAYDLITKYHDRIGIETDYLFCAHKLNTLEAYDSPITRTNLLMIIKQIGHKAGIEKTISPHKIRHSFATELVNNGCDVYSVCNLLGHASVSTTMKYAHLNTNKMLDDCMKYHSGYKN